MVSDQGLGPAAVQGGPFALVHDLILAARSKPAPQPDATSPAVALPGDNARSIALPPASRLEFDGDLYDVIAGRRSVSLRGAGPLSLAQLSDLLGSVETVKSGALCPNPDLQVKLFVVVLEIPPLVPAVYRYDDVDHRLALVDRVEREVVRERVLLQSNQGDASALLFVVTPLAAWLCRHGDRGYRAAMMSIGWIIDGLYLRAQQLGLCCSATGGFALARANELLHLDGYAMTTALAFAVGATDGRR